MAIPVQFLVTFQTRGHDGYTPEQVGAALIAFLNTPAGMAGMTEELNLLINRADEVLTPNRAPVCGEVLICRSIPGGEG